LAGVHIIQNDFPIDLCIVNEIRELKSKGMETGKIDGTPWGRFAQLKDLDGNGLTFHQK
jgi:hypothetical protein